DSPVTQYQFAVRKLRWQTHDQRPKHVAAARCVLVWGEVPAIGIDVYGIEFRRDGIRVVRNEFALDFLQNASRFRIKVLDGEFTVLSFELKRVPYSPVIPGLFPLAKGGRFAVFKQWPQFVFLVERTFGTDDFKSGLVLEDKCHGFIGNKRSVT